MNIFILDEDLDKCAEYHVDKHIVKMPLEAGQMLCTVHWTQKYAGYVPHRKLTSEEWASVSIQKKNDPRDFPYLPTMYNHPCTIWARSSKSNYDWLYCYALALGEEYTYRYGKVHKSVEMVLGLPPIDLPDIGLTPFAQAMPDDCKRECAVEAYREFYHKDKAVFADWKFRDKPEWWDEQSADYENRISR